MIITVEYPKKTKTSIKSSSFKDAARKYYAIIGGKKFFSRNHFASIAPTFRFHGKFVTKRQLWIWCDGKIYNY